MWFFRQATNHLHSSYWGQSTWSECCHWPSIIEIFSRRAKNWRGCFNLRKVYWQEGLSHLQGLLLLDPQCPYFSLISQLWFSSFADHYLRCTLHQKSRTVLSSFNLFVCHSEEESKNKHNGKQQGIRQVLGIPHKIQGTSPGLPYPTFNNFLITASSESQAFQEMGALCRQFFSESQIIFSGKENWHLKLMDLCQPSKDPCLYFSDNSDICTMWLDCYYQ